MKVFNGIRFIIACLRFIKDITRTDLIIQAGESMGSEEKMKVPVQYIMSFPENAEVVNSRYKGMHIDVEKLLKYPAGTLGYEYGNFLKNNNLSPVFYAPIEVTNNTSYIRLRIRQLHDVWHVLFGYDISAQGELAIQAVTIQHTQGPFGALIFSLLLVHIAIFTPQKIIESMEIAFLAWQRAKVSKPIVAIQFEEYLEKPISEIRAAYNIVA